MGDREIGAGGRDDDGERGNLEARRAPITVFTIGHSTRSLEELLELLRGFGATLLLDVRTVPRSRRNPQFDRSTLPAALEAAGMAYRHVPALGGLRKPRRDSVNVAWRNPSFRGFADHMQTPGFAAAVEEVLELARERRVVLMCAEAVPWRCHRSLIADALTARGVAVRHITGRGRDEAHRVTPWARIRGTTVTYPGSASGTEAGSGS